MGVVFIESGLGAGQRQDGKRTAKKMKLEAGPVRRRSEEQLAFRTVPDMDFMVLRIPGQSAPSFSIEADPEKSWSCKDECMVRFLDRARERGEVSLHLNCGNGSRQLQVLTGRNTDLTFVRLIVAALSSKLLLDCGFLPPLRPSPFSLCCEAEGAKGKGGCASVAGRVSLPSRARMQGKQSDGHERPSAPASSQSRRSDDEAAVPWHQTDSISAIILQVRLPSDETSGKQVGVHGTLRSSPTASGSDARSCRPLSCTARLRCTAQTLAGLTWHRQAIPQRVDGSHGRIGRQSTLDNNIVALLAPEDWLVRCVAGSLGRPYFSDHCDNANNLPRPRKLRSSVFRDVWENWWIGQGAPRPAEIHRGHPLGPEMGLKMEISRQKEMVPSKLAPNDRSTWVQMSYTYLRRCPARLVPGSFGWVPRLPCRVWCGCLWDWDGRGTGVWSKRQLMPTTSSTPKEFLSYFEYHERLPKREAYRTTPLPPPPQQQQPSTQQKHKAYALFDDTLSNPNSRRLHFGVSINRQDDHQGVSVCLQLRPWRLRYHRCPQAPTAAQAQPEVKGPRSLSGPDACLFIP
ncbi:hypothetical protein B0T13DRAFT_491067 [Neurospora crassa]|nr:hypothetical protein B0T13DRAFT_491067 [Neurospora crassa]